MALSPDQEIIVRTWVGDDPTTSELEDLYTVLGSWDEVVRATLRRKIALLSEDPTSLTVPGLSISNSSQISALQQMLKDFNNSGGTGLDADSAMGVMTGRIVRANNVR
jgi:hypothetical protein